ncbi:MAG: aldo/keto reductase [Candidatus Hodarchaeota archaeon]
MKYIELGKNNEKVSAIGLGTWQFGTKGWGYGKEFDKSTAINIINLAIDNGVNLIDTAELYGDGMSEKIIGEAIKNRHDEVFIATKVAPYNTGYRSLKRSCDRSLTKLGIKTIDLYQIHWPNPLLSTRRTIKALDELVDEGKIRYIGVSNFSIGRLKKVQELTRHEIVSNQVSYSLANLKIEEKLLPYCKESGIKIIAYSPLAQGLLTGKYTPENPLRSLGVRRINNLFSPRNLKKAMPLINKLKEVGEKYNRSAAQVSLNYLIADDSVIAIPGAKNETQLMSNIRAADFELERNDIDELRKVAKQFNPTKIGSLQWIAGIQT